MLKSLTNTHLRIKNTPRMAGSNLKIHKWLPRRHPFFDNAGDPHTSRAGATGSLLISRAVLSQEEHRKHDTQDEPQRIGLVESAALSAKQPRQTDDPNEPGSVSGKITGVLDAN